MLNKEGQISFPFWMSTLYIIDGLHNQWEESGWRVVETTSHPPTHVGYLDKLINLWTSLGIRMISHPTDKRLWHILIIFMLLDERL